MGDDAYLGQPEQFQPWYSTAVLLLAGYRSHCCALIPRPTDMPAAEERDEINSVNCINQRGSALFNVRWHRVILDEAQSIKNRQTKIAHAVCLLEVCISVPITETLLVCTPWSSS